MRKKVLLLFSIVIAILFLLTILFRNRYILIRLHFGDSNQEILLEGTGSFVLKNPFRNRALEMRCFKVINAIIENSNNGKMDIDYLQKKYADLFEDGLKITLNRASENPQKYLTNYKVHDILSKKDFLILVLYFGKYGRGCMYFKKSNLKVNDFYVIF